VNKNQERFFFLKHRKLIYLSLGLVLILTTMLNYKTCQEIKISEELALSNSVKMTETRSMYLSGYFESAENTLTNIRSILLDLHTADKFDRELMNDMLLSNLNLEQNILCLWIYMEPNALDVDVDNKDALGSNKVGTYAPWFYYDTNKTSIIKTFCGSDQFKFYEYPRRLKREVLLEPYQTVNERDRFFITLAQPIIQNRFIGAIGIDWF